MANDPSEWNEGGCTCSTPPGLFPCRHCEDTVECTKCGALFYADKSGICPSNLCRYCLESAAAAQPVKGRTDVQRIQLLKYLKEHPEGISSLEAALKLGCARAASRVHELRKAAGNLIESGPEAFIATVYNKEAGHYRYILGEYLKDA